VAAELKGSGREVSQKMQKNIKKIKIIRKTNKGFTLVEMLVSISIFSMAMTIVAQLFFYSLSAEKRVAAHSQLVNEMSYNMEHISRGIRMVKKIPTGQTDGCSALVVPGMNFALDPDPSVSGIIYRNDNTAGGVDCVEYYTCHPGNPCYPTTGYSGVTVLMESRMSYTSAGVPIFNFNLPLTSPKINITNFSVTGIGWSQTDEAQPRVTLYIQAQNDQKEILKNQVTISQRDIDIQQ
jgi:prepilin-type N-terminal cleavage/methylation domain-containing protein